MACLSGCPLHLETAFSSAPPKTRSSTRARELPLSTMYLCHRLPARNKLSDAYQQHAWSATRCPTNTQATRKREGMRFHYTVRAGTQNVRARETRNSPFWKTRLNVVEFVLVANTRGALADCWLRHLCAGIYRPQISPACTTQPHLF